MPVQKFSAMDPSGSWNMDARDQTAMWNADRGDRINMWQTNRMDQRSQDDWRKDVALQQIAQGDRFFQGNREDNASARQAAAAAELQRYGYMTNRDKLGDERWKSEFEQNRLNQEEQRKWRGEDRTIALNEYNELKPQRQAELEIAQGRLARMKQEQGYMAEASGTAMYVPVTDKGREVFQATKAMTGNIQQASMAAKAADQAKAGERAGAEQDQLGTMLEDYKVKDEAFFGSDPDSTETSAISAKADALIEVLVSQGFDKQTAKSMVAKIMRDKLTDGGRTDWNQAPSEQLISRYGGSFR